jgi:hypothetical protein
MKLQWPWPGWSLVPLEREQCLGNCTRIFTIYFIIIIHQAESNFPPQVVLIGFKELGPNGKLVVDGNCQWGGEEGCAAPRSSGSGKKASGTVLVS